MKRADRMIPRLMLRVELPFNEIMVCEWYGAGSFIASTEDFDAAAFECPASAPEGAFSEKQGGGLGLRARHIGDLPRTAERWGAWPTLIPRGSGGLSRDRDSTLTTG